MDDTLSKKGEPRYILGDQELVANEAFTDFGPFDAAGVMVRMVAIFDTLTYDQRARVLARLGIQPVRKFFDEQSGATISFHKWYGFCEGGGLAGSFDGYNSADEAIAEIKKVYPEYIANAVQAGYPEMSTDPAQLGVEWCVVITGEQFVAQLQKTGEPLDTFGRML